MLKLRLARFGCKNRPFYRVVAISSKRARDAQPIEYVSGPPRRAAPRRAARRRRPPPACASAPARPRAPQVGTYDPLPSGLDSTKEVRLRLDRVKHWLAVGAQPSPRVAYLLWRAGLLPPPPIAHTPTRWIPKQVRRDAAKKKFSTWAGGGGAGGAAGAAPRLASFSGFARSPPLFSFR